MWEHEVQMSKRKPLYIKAKERTSHVLKRLEASKYAVCSLHIIYIYIQASFPASPSFCARRESLGQG